MKKIRCFLNDNDGLTATDFLMINIFILYVFFKIFNIIMVFICSKDTLLLINDILMDINVFMESVVKFYFAVKGVSVLTNYFLGKKSNNNINNKGDDIL